MTILPAPRTLPLDRLVAQMFVVRASGHLFDGQIRYPAWEPNRAALSELVVDRGIGGVLLIDGSAAEVALRTEALQTEADIPLLVCADIEEGVGQRFAGASHLPPLMALGAIAQTNPERATELAREMGRVTAREALAIGINWILAPVVDVNNNAANPVINVRSFGDDPAIVATLATAFIEGARELAVLTTAKHFPGHGDTSVDSHWELPTIAHDRARMDAIELLPFKDAIAANVDSVMTAHVKVPLWDAKNPATLSPAITTGVLREELGFDGLIATDALVMGAIAREYSNEAAILGAVKAGADVVLMPDDAIDGIEAVCRAVESGEITRDRIEASVARIFAAKAQVDFSETGGVAADELRDRIATPDAIDLDRQILTASRKSGGLLPIDDLDASPRNVIIVDDLFRCSVLGHHRAAVAVPQQQGYELLCLDAQSFRDPDLSVIPGAIVLQVFVRGNPFGSSAALAAMAQRWLEAAIERDRLTGLVVYGSPYAFEQFRACFPSASVPFVFSFSQTPEAQILAMEKLFGSGAMSWQGFKPNA
ncbi:MAG: glycoside hydrolase family 3 protein [Geitlerinemataceae cyanobacterium]